MNTNQILNKVRVLLGMEVKLEQMKLADGVTVIEAESFEPEMEVLQLIRLACSFLDCHYEPTCLRSQPRASHHSFVRTGLHLLG